MRKNIFPKVIPLIAVVAFIFSCKSGNQNQNSNSKTDSTNVEQIDTSTVANPDTTKGANNTKPKADLSIVKIYNFHVTNRCVSCIAIEDATTKTLKTYFSAEMKQGRIKRQILNVDDEANSAIAEKYQAFGSGLFVTRVFKGKETTTDLTGDGFKYAKNKEEKFIEILKSTITNYLK